jgi:hypothetical protein
VLDIAILIAICVGSSFFAAIGVARWSHREGSCTARQRALRGEIQGGLESLDEPELQAVRRMIRALLDQRTDLHPDTAAVISESERGA